MGISSGAKWESGKSNVLALRTESWRVDLVDHVLEIPGVPAQLMLRGNPPVGTCTICVGKKEIGWQSHFGVVRALENQNFYRGE